MKKITTIPSKKIAFKNVPVKGIFFVKRSLYTKISANEALQKVSQEPAHFNNDTIVRFIQKQYETEAYEIMGNEEDHEDIVIRDIVEIKKYGAVGRVVSIDDGRYMVQYKRNESIQFDSFDRDEIKKATSI